MNKKISAIIAGVAAVFTILAIPASAVTYSSTGLVYCDAAPYVGQTMCPLTTINADGSVHQETMGEFKIDGGITSVDSATYTVAFDTQQSHDTLKPYFVKAVTQVNGISASIGSAFKVVVSDTLYTTGNANAAPPYHTIVARLSSTLPTGVSTTGQWIGGSHTDWGANINMNAGYWASDSNVPAFEKWNLVTHEFGHALGLTHPNSHHVNGTDVDQDCRKGTWSAYNTASYGYQKSIVPVMCYGIGGFQNNLNAAGLFTPYDIQGLRFLIVNKSLIPVTTSSLTSKTAKGAQVTPTPTRQVR
jgi:hypothetical protein